MWLISTIVDGHIIEHFRHRRKLYWTTVLERPWEAVRGQECEARTLGVPRKAKSSCQWKKQEAGGHCRGDQEELIIWIRVLHFLDRTQRLGCSSQGSAETRWSLFWNLGTPEPVSAASLVAVRNSMSLHPKRLHIPQWLCFALFLDHFWRLQLQKSGGGD